MRWTLVCLAVLVAVGAVAAAAKDKPTGGKDPNAAKEGGEPGQGVPDNVYASGLFQEVYIDEDYKLYKVRKYQGRVPGRDPEVKPEEAPAGAGTPADGEAGGKKKETKTKIERIGFEQRELFSRVFVMADRAVSPWIYDNFVQANADPGVKHQVFVELGGAVIPLENDRRPLVTSAFNTPVQSVQGVAMKGGTRVVITLKREARYLPVQVGKVLYVDIER